MTEPRKKASPRPSMHNEATGTGSGPVVQAGSIHGDIHLHAPHRPDLFWPATSTLVIFAVTTVLAVGVWNTKSENYQVVTAGVVAVAAAVLLITLWLLWKRTRRPVLPQSALNRLRSQVRAQWSDEASHRGLRRPQPLRLRWRPTSSPVERAYADTEQPDADLMRGELVQTADDLSPADALASAFEDISRRQLVVLGPPGAGKSTLAVLFTLAVIDQDTDENPVPVLLSVAGWDPTQRIEDWCVRRIAEDYPDFGANGIFNPEQLSDLLLNRRIVPVLDGLDEMPRPVLSTALADLDRAAEVGLRMVLTCRSAEFEQAVHDHGALAHAAVIDIEPIRVEDIAAYLTEPEVANTRRWSPVIEQIRREPSGPLAHALSTPLMINLARSIYRSPSSTPDELTSFTTTPAITNHLLKNYLPTVFTDGKHEKSQQWLSFLSHHLQEQGGPNFEWWRLARSVPRWLLLLITTLVTAACCSIPLFFYNLYNFILASQSDSINIYDPWTETAFGATAGAFVGILGGLHTIRSLEESERSRSRHTRANALIYTLSTIRNLIVILCVLSTLFIFAAWVVGHGFIDDIAFTIAMQIYQLVTFNDEAWISATPLFIIAIQATLIINFLGLRAGVPKSSTPNVRRLLPSLTTGMLLGLAFSVLWVASALLQFARLQMPENLNYSDLNIHYYAFIAIMTGIPMGIVRWLAEPVEEHKASSPVSVLLGDRAALLTAALSSGALTVLGMGPLLFPGLREASGGVEIVETMAESGAVVLVIMMVVVMGSGSAWVSYTIARLWLTCRGRLPWRLMHFLRTAHKNGVLRQVGPAYQLRHELLRTHLVEQRSSERRPPPARPFIHRQLGVRRRSRARVHPWWYSVGNLAVAVLLMGASSVIYFGNSVLPLGVPANAAEFSPDGHTLAVTTDHRAHLWDVESKSIRETIDIHVAEVIDMAFSPDSTIIAIVSYSYSYSDGYSDGTDGESTVQLRDTTTGQPTAKPLPHNGLVNTVAFNPDGTTLATASWDGTARLWDITTGQPTHTFGGHNDQVRSVTFGPNSNLLAATSTDDDTVQLWDTTTDPPTTEPLTHNSQVESVEFSPDGTTLATTNYDEDEDSSTVQLWNTQTGNSTTKPLTHNGQVESVEFSPDGTTLATISGDGTARLWDTTGPPIHTFGGHNNWVRSVVFSPDGTTLATASKDGSSSDDNSTARLWNTRTGDPLTEPLHHNGWVNTVAFSPDGTTLATASWDGTARLWDLCREIARADLPQAQQQACHSRDADRRN